VGGNFFGVDIYSDAAYKEKKEIKIGAFLIK